jgi:hypothetical protein
VLLITIGDGMTMRTISPLVIDRDRDLTRKSDVNVSRISNVTTWHFQMYQLAGFPFSIPRPERPADEHQEGIEESEGLSSRICLPSSKGRENEHHW